MKSLLFLLFFMVAVSVSDAQSPTAAIANYRHLIHSHESRIRNQMNVSNDLFFDVVDTLTGYCTDSKFTIAQQLQNIQGLARFMSKVTDKDQIHSGQYTNLLLFYFSIMDWRLEGDYFDKLNNFSSFAMKCASFFAEDSTGMKFISKVAEQNPVQVLSNAEQLSESRARYHTLIENVVLRDPEYAKRYFFSDNLVSGCTSGSYRKEVKGLYDIFEQYGPKTKSFILYDAVMRGEIRPSEADSISHDNLQMIEEMVSILKRPGAAAVKSIHREMDLRCTEWFRQSAQWTPAIVTTQFNKYVTDEKLAMLVFGYKECKPQLLDQYLSLLMQPDLASVSPALIDNLQGNNLPDFLHLLEKKDKLALFLSWFSDASKEKLTQAILTEESDSVPQGLESLARNKVWAADVQETVEAARSSRRDEAELTTPVAGLHRRTQPLFDDVSGQVHITLSDSSKAILGLKKNVFMALQDIPSFIHKSYAKDLLLYAATVEPDEVFKKVDMFKGKYWSKEILEAATLNAPLTAKQYLNNATHPVPVILAYSTDSTIIKFMELSREAKLDSRPFLLFDEMANNCLSLTDASTVCEDNDALFRKLMTISSRKSYIGRYNVEREMNYYALKYIRGINDKINMPERERFASVDNLTCNELYYLMVYGREEIFISTFEGLFSRFLTKCSATGYWSAHRFASLPHYRSFIALCAAYNQLDRFLAIFSPADQTALLTTFASSLDKERDELSDAATVAQTIANTTNPVVLQTLQNTIKTSYTSLELIHDYNGMAIYGILSALYRDKAQTDRKWFALMARKYRVGALATLTNASLTDHKIFVERMYFYNDEDGLDSYRNFMVTFSASPNWQIEQFPTYVKLTTTNGKKIEIYANKPEYEETGDKDIAKVIADNKYTVTGIVHRGHSFHTDVTVTRIPSSARFIFLGSCGGFYKINSALRKAPDASIISTRQIGVKEINDPIVFSFNEYIREGKDVNWKLFWDEMSNKLGSNNLFSDYVPPHKNIESLFVKAYYQIMGNE